MFLKNPLLQNHNSKFSIHIHRPLLGLIFVLATQFPALAATNSKVIKKSPKKTASINSFHSLEKGLLLRTLTAGKGSDTVKTGDNIQVHYKGWIKDTIPFDNSYERNQSIEFVLGTGKVIPGWEKGLIGMKKGEIRELKLAPEWGYGESSFGPIEANSPLRFEVELIDIGEPLTLDTLKEMGSIRWSSLKPGLEYYDEIIGSDTTNQNSDELKIHYTGWLKTGKEIGSSKKTGEAITLNLNEGRVISGWEKGLKNLKAKTTRWLKLDPSFGYGNMATADIPPNSDLIFKIQVLNKLAPTAEAQTGMDIFPNIKTTPWIEDKSGLAYAILQKGDDSKKAEFGQKVFVHYTGWLEDGTLFDSSRKRGEAFSFQIGAGQVIRGWEKGVEGMAVGEKRLLKIPAKLGYGAQGNAAIPGNSTLIFSIEYLGNE